MKRFLQGLSAQTSPYVGKTYKVGRLECLIEDQIAEGGFSLVFLVRANNGKHYALKRISVNNRKDLAIGKQEINVMKSVSNHKNIITYIDSSVSEVSHGIYEVLILMEYCRDDHVIQLMNENLNSGLNEELVLRIFTDICEAVEALHHSQSPIQHRDLKVENILRNAKGDFVLCDYGSTSVTPINLKECNLTEVEEEIQKFTTLSYRSPEMVDLYSGKIIDTKADIWALGVLLYKLCFFTVPFGESILAIQNGQFSIPDNSKYSKGIHNLIRYILEPDPDIRPDIYQVSSTAFQLRKLSCPVTRNIKNSAIPKQLPDDINKLATPDKSKVVRQVHEPVSTSLKPRNRPRAGAGNMTPAVNVPVGTSTTEPHASSTPSTLLQQAKAFQHYPENTPQQQQNFPTSPPLARHSIAHVDPRARSPAQPAYLNPFGERPSREPSPVGKRLDLPNREFTHVRSRSDPVPFVRDDCPVGAGVPRNLVPGNQEQPARATDVPHRQDTFPKWYFSNRNDFVLNTETTDDDFASLREPAPVPHGSHRSSVNQPSAGPQFVSGNVHPRYAPPANAMNVITTSNSSSPFSSKSSSGRNSDSDSDTVPAKPIMHSGKEDNKAGSSLMHGYAGRKNNTSIQAPVNAGCDVDEVTTIIERKMKAREQPPRVSSGRQTTTTVFDAVPFRKPEPEDIAKATPAPPTSPGRDPFGAVPFKQKEAAKLVRRQARRSHKTEQSGGDGDQRKARRVLPIVPTQTRS